MENVKSQADYVTASLANATSLIVSEYLKAIGPLAASRLDAAELGRITASVRRELRGDPMETMKKTEIQSLRPIPPVHPAKTIYPDRIISLEDGKSYKSLKRHIGKHGMTPEEYRAKWDLPDDYPMVCPDYAARRSELAKGMGLGKTENRRKAQDMANG